MTPQTLNALKPEKLPDVNHLSYEPLSGSQARPEIRTPTGESLHGLRLQLKGPEFFGDSESQALPAEGWSGYVLS